MIRPAFLVVFSFNLVCFSLGSFPLPYITPDSCSSEEYFDSVCLRCRKCGANRRDGQESLQQPGRGGSSCMCKPQYYQKERKGPYNVVCAQCPENKVPSVDGHSCISCGESNPYNETTGLCEPCEAGLIVEDGEKQMCLACKSETISNKRMLSCMNCSGEMKASFDKCGCLSNLTLSGGHCLPRVRDKSSLFTVKYENGVSVRSAFFVEHFNAAYHNCKEHANITACQVLANMCVLLLYKLDSRLTAIDACSEFMTLIKEQKEECNASGHVFGLWLLYSEDAGKELHRKNLPNVYSASSNLNSSELQFVVVKYDLNGSFLKMQQLKSHELQLCQPFTNAEDIDFSFGTSIQRKCQLPLRELWDSSESIFYELYLLSNANNNKSELYPVPVLIKELKVNSESVNEEEDVSKWQLVRRFFLTDAVSGIETGTSLLSKHNQPLAKVFRYAKDVSLIVRLRSDGPAGSIYPPLLVISYGEATPDDYLRNKKVPLKYSVLYEMDQSKADSGVSIALGIFGTLASLWSLMQTWSWFRRAGKQAIDVLTLGKFLVFFCGNLSTTFFIVVFCVSLNWFIVFKMQDVVHILLPTAEQEKFIGTYLGIAFAMKAFQVIHLLVTQCNIDIFFIDWERPRARASCVTNRPPSAGSSAKPVAETPAGGTSTSGKVATGKGTPDKINAEMAGISIWRTYFVANEWAEIQAMRKVNLSLQLFGTLFFLKVIKFEDLTYSTFLPSSSVHDVQGDVPYSTCCRFALGAAVYLSLALVQVVIRKAIYERFIEDKLQQYVDLCSVSNVSVFILVTKRFGYYIHGRSAHGKADVNMKEMHELLRREEEDLCGHRGLLPNTEQQTFLMGLPPGVYEQFKRFLGPLTMYSQAADRMQGVGGSLAKVDIDKVVSTYHTLNKFLAGFIEHAFKDLDYVVKDKVMLENLMDIELTKPIDRGYFYNDTGHSFDSVLLFGNESILLIFEVLLFSIIDFTSCDYVLAAVLTYLVGKAIQGVRMSTGRRNLVRKALVDERFLT